MQLSFLPVQPGKSQATELFRHPALNKPFQRRVDGSECQGSSVQKPHSVRSSGLVATAQPQGGRVVPASIFYRLVPPLTDDVDVGVDIYAIGKAVAHLEEGSLSETRKADFLKMHA